MPPADAARRCSRLHDPRMSVEDGTEFCSLPEAYQSEYRRVALIGLRYSQRQLIYRLSVPQLSRKQGRGRVDSRYVFTGKVADKPFHDLKRQLENAVAKAGLAGVTFHVLRHTFASHLVMAGVDLATVKALLRPKSIDMTLRYAHLSPEHKRSAIDTLVSAYSIEDDEATGRT